MQQGQTYVPGIMNLYPLHARQYFDYSHFKSSEYGEDKNCKMNFVVMYLILHVQDAHSQKSSFSLCYYKFLQEIHNAISQIKGSKFFFVYLQVLTGNV